jgi:hypothetical protein
MGEGPSYYDGDVPSDPFLVRDIFKRYIFDYGGGSPLDHGVDEHFATYKTVTFSPKPCDLVFDIQTLTGMWAGFPGPQNDSELLARLLAKNVEVFTAALAEHEIEWNSLDGDFNAPTKRWAVWASKGEGPHLPETMLALWTGCFETVAVFHYEETVAGLKQERAHDLDS